MGGGGKLLAQRSGQCRMSRPACARRRRRGRGGGGAPSSETRVARVGHRGPERSPGLHESCTERAARKAENGKRVFSRAQAGRKPLGGPPPPPSARPRARARRESRKRAVSRARSRGAFPAASTASGHAPRQGRRAAVAAPAPQGRHTAAAPPPPFVQVVYNVPTYSEQPINVTPQGREPRRCLWRELI